MKKIRNGETQKQRKTRNRRIANAIDIYYIHPNLPMDRQYWSNKIHAPATGDPS